MKTSELGFKLELKHMVDTWINRENYGIKIFYNYLLKFERIQADDCEKLIIRPT